MERGIFYGKAEENGVLHCKRTSFSFGFKTEVRKTCNSLNSRLARGNRNLYIRAHTSSCQREPSHMLPTLPSTFCIAENQDDTQGAFGCALTLYQTIFLKLERNFYLLAPFWFCFGFFFLQCPLAALGSRLEARFKLLQVQRCPRIQYKYSPARRGDTLWPQLLQPHARESYSAVRGGYRNDRGRREDPYSMSYCPTIAS